MSTAVAAPGHTTGARLWAQLGNTGSIARIYHDGDPAAGVDPARLGDLLATVDADAEIGATLAVCVQVATALPLLATGDEIAREAMHRALAGECIVALAATDEAAGSDLTALATEIRICETDLEIHGTKRWITNATCANELLVLARHRPGQHFASFTWVLVPADAPGVHVEPADTQMFDGSCTGHIHLDHVRLSRDRLVGRVGRGLPSFAAHIAVERLAGALWGVALCRRVLADTKRRLLARRHGVVTLWHVDGIRQRFAACLVLTRQLHALTCELADQVASRHDTTAAAMLKSSVAVTLDQVLGECAHLQGAEGFSSTGAQKLRAQAALFGIGGGATEVVLSVVGDNADAVLDGLTP